MYDKYLLRNLIQVSNVEPVQTQDDINIPAKKTESKCNCSFAALGFGSFLQSDTSAYFDVIEQLKKKIEYLRS